MSGLAKVFIVVNFVFSVVFLASAGMLLAKSDDWRSKFEQEQTDHSDTKAKLNKEIDDLRSSKGRLQSDLDNVKNDMNDERVAKEGYQKDLNDTRGSNKELRDSLNQLQETFSNLQGNLTTGQARITTLEQELETANSRADDAVNRQMNAEDNLTRAQSDLSGTRDRVSGLEEQVAALDEEIMDLQLMVDFAKGRGFEFDKIQAPPPINGFVKAANMENGVFILSVGSDDQVQKGFKFFVSRGGRYLGELVVDQVQADLCSAVAREPLEDVVKPMDQVTTRL